MTNVDSLVRYIQHLHAKFTTYTTMRINDVSIAMLTKQFYTNIIINIGVKLFHFTLGILQPAKISAISFFTRCLIFFFSPGKSSFFAVPNK